MRKYKVKISLVFDGESTVMANSRREAEDIATSEIRGIFGYACLANMREHIVIDWDIDQHSETILRK